MRMEHSDRAKWVTEQVALWLANDGEFYDTARKLARQGSLPDMAPAYVELLRRADPRTTHAGWLAAQLAPEDYDRIHWADVAAELLTE